jgi:hypothetical protein
MIYCCVLQPIIVLQTAEHNLSKYLMGLEMFLEKVYPSVVFVLLIIY